MKIELSHKANETEDMILFYDERRNAAATFICQGNPGHGLMFIENTAGEKVHKIVGKMLGFREEQKKLLADNPGKI